MRDVYQDLYDNHKYCRAPERAIRSIISMIDKWLYGNIIDLGCGRGYYVNELRRRRFRAVGVDFITLKNTMLVGDITRDMDLTLFDTAICLDVFEHLNDNDVIQVLKNMQKVKFQVIHINNKKCKLHNIDLHINLKSYEEWKDFISKYLYICENPYNKKIDSLFFCRNYA